MYDLQIDSKNIRLFFESIGKSNKLIVSVTCFYFALLKAHKYEGSSSGCLTVLIDCNIVISLVLGST